MKAADNVRLPDVFAPDTPVLVAFSGGADSTLLLHLLHGRAKETGAALYAVHVHHGIRGKDAERCTFRCLPSRSTCPRLQKSPGKALRRQQGTRATAILRV